MSRRAGSGHRSKEVAAVPEQQEYVRITQKRLNELIAIGKRVIEVTDDHSEIRRGMKFKAMMQFPTVDELERFMPEMPVREAVPFLVFYGSGEVFDIPGDPDFAKTKEFVSRYFRENVDVIDDADYERVSRISPAAWRKMPSGKREEAFDGLISYYGPDEFETFVKDLGYLPLMGAYGLSSARYSKGELDPLLAHDLLKVWKAVQARTAECL